MCKQSYYVGYFQKGNDVLKRVEEGAKFMAVPLVIDALDFARNAGLRRGKIAVSEFERLQDYLVDSSGELEYGVTGALNINGRPVLRIDIRGAISLKCQRCLEKLEHVLDVHTELLLAQNEQELQSFDEDESVECIPVQPDMDVLALIEDEIILSVPISPRHEPSECRADGRRDEKGSGETSPFAALAALKKTH